MSDFDAVFAATIDVEGGLSTDPRDPGNWTGGAAGKGALRGTKFGISAAAYPSLDIAGLTLDQARAIYAADRWRPIAGDALPRVVQLLVFGAAVNQGVGAAAKLLQAAAGVDPDGVIGGLTLAAVRRMSDRALWVELTARRALRYASTNGLQVYGLGWFRRLAAEAGFMLFPKP